MATQAPPMVGLRIGVKGSSMAAPSSQSTSVRVCLRSSFFGNNVGALRVSRLQLACSNRLKCNVHGGGSFGSQMNLFDRFARVIKSYANAFISRFEDPEKIIEQAVLEMNGDLIEMRRSTAQVLASQKQLENKYKECQQASEDWYKRGQLALSKGDEELAREALKRRKSFADNASALKTQLDQQKNIVGTLVSNIRILESKIDDAKSKKDTLKARAQSAKTATMVSEMVGKVSTSSALATFDKMEEKVMAMELEAEALYQLSRDELEGKFAFLEGTSVDDDLANLKKELLKGELPPGRTAVASMPRFRDIGIEQELNELRTRAINY